jgi:prepilin-type processing-associated H-X9-DG protein
MNAEAVTCPICREPNGCQLWGNAGYKGPCWCMGLEVADAVLAQVPVELRKRSCICRKCIELFHPEPNRTKRLRAFTVVELMVVVAVVVILAGLLLPALARSKAAGQNAECTSNLRQLGIATELYWGDYNQQCFTYIFGQTNYGEIWWFGWIGPGAEETRAFDLSSGALFPYLNGSDVRICPALNYSLAQFKLKADGIVFSYGYNRYLSTPPGKPIIKAAFLHQPSQTALYADAAQVNNFQAPASASNPMLEEFYYIDLETNYANPLNYPNGHFRHAQKCNVIFCDGHAGPETAVAGSFDPKLPGQYVGQLQPAILSVP